MDKSITAVKDVVFIKCLRKNTLIIEALIKSALIFVKQTKPNPGKSNEFTYKEIVVTLHFSDIFTQVTGLNFEFYTFPLF